VFINYPHRKQTVPLRIIVPNMFTTVAMCCGLASIQYSLKNDWDRSMFAVILSAIFDSLDGRAARLLKVASPFGEVLDSLADFLSFGIAPAVLLYLWLFKHMGPEGSVLDLVGLVAVTAFVVCSAMRLARFTAAARPVPAVPPSGAPGAPVHSGSSAPDADQQKAALVKAKFFVGLATPSAAAAVMVPVMLSYSTLVGPWVRPLFNMPPVGPGDESAARQDSAAHPDFWVAMVVVLYTALIAYWMVSRIPMFSFKKMRVNRRAVVPLLIAAALVAVPLAVKDLWLLIAGLAVVYLLTFPASLISQSRIYRKS
jgi:CDP-diacylglycerol--serine O-phosphatidyltransferase